ncbi:MAG TPA: 7TM diverse intracellular signaling domain-containing protein, partial [Oligoflexus sp.]|uniref:7TM diverse intracellular signaling domain-containing protein n=1 Tax=Oligoflexus sp. TaxID=1971216 RepID=UPI002D3A317C
TGRVGPSDDPKHYEPGVRTGRKIFTPKSAEFDIVIQTASFEFFTTGITGTPQIGTIAGIQQNRERAIFVDVFLIGSLLIMAIYHFVLFALRTKARSTFCFGMVCLASCVYMLAASGQTAVIIFPDLSFPAQLKLFNTWVIGLPFFAYFTYELFPRYYSRYVIYFAFITVVPFYAFILATEPRTFVDLTLWMQLETLLVGGYSIVAVIRSVWAKEEGSVLFLSGTALFLSAAIHDILLSGGRVVFQSYPMGSVGVFSFVCFQSILLARRFSNAFIRAEVSEIEIRKLSDDLRVERDHVVSMNENLELLVDEKTRDIRSIMAHIQLGIFAIGREQFRIEKDYSQHLKDLFEATELADADACTVLFEATSLSSDEISQAVNALAASLGETMLAYDMNAHCLPRELKRRRKDGKDRILDISWNPIANDEDVIEKMLVTVRDVTELRALEEEAQDRKEELQFIGELINVTPEAFRRFIHSCYDFIYENRKLLNSQSIYQKDLEVLKVLFINMHTMKGAARSLYFKKMTRIFHDVEQYYAILQREPQVKWDVQKMKNDLDEVERIVTTYAEINKEKLGRKSGDERDVELTEGQVISMYRGLSNVEESYKEVFRAKDSALLTDMKSSLFPLIFTPAEHVLVDICQCVTTLAKDLDKAKPVIRIQAEGLFMTRHGEDLLRRVFVHILRNTMDHGIEKPQVRKNKGKPEAGLITITMEKGPESVLLRYQDDGRGLDIEAIRNRAKSQNFAEYSDSLSLQDAAELIFCSGLSTATKVGDISGRGVGMDAVRKYLRKEEGDIELQLLDPRGVTTGCYPFLFLIRLPLELFASDQSLTINEAA